MSLQLNNNHLMQKSLLSVLQTIQYVLHKDIMHNGGVSCDLARALYCYNMIIIQPSRIQGKIGQWLKSYLPDRKQKTRNQTMRFKYVQ